uniref:Programmed cell death protein 2 C-terminal domain-containing protein n=1 Tax=Arion vulgaris TaxID=1028688 RepID=A0A0B6ZVD7_9EUPU
MSILIGLIDQRIQDSQPIGWDTNKIGGLPAWISSATSLPECKNCGKTSSLVAQLYCPLGGSSFHRCLYLFVCPGECSKQQNGWRVFRSMKHDNTENLLEVDTIMLTDTERWDAMAKLLNTKLEQAPEPTRTNTDCTIVFEPYYLSVVDEPSDQSESYDHVNDLIRNYERSEGKQLNQLICERSTSSKGREGPSELYEKSELKHGDRIFYKFLKRLQKCPQQCVRYERGGSPLLVSGLTEQTIKRCSHCGGEFIFELQLLPPLIPFLKAQNGTPCEVEFGTVLIFTCERNCWPAEHDQYDLLEELIVLQGDPDIHLYR